MVHRCRLRGGGGAAGVRAEREWRGAWGGRGCQADRVGGVGDVCGAGGVRGAGGARGEGRAGAGWPAGRLGAPQRYSGMKGVSRPVGRLVTPPPVTW